MSLARVTGIFGANSSGKSSILQFLLMLKQTKNATDRGLVLDFGGLGELVNLGSFRDVVHGHDETQSIQWMLDWRLPGKLKIKDPEAEGKILFEGDSVQNECKVVSENSKLRAEFLKYRFANEEFSLRPKTGTKGRFELDGGFHFVRTHGRVWPLRGPVKTHLFPDQAQTYYQNSGFLGEFEAAYERLMDGIYYLGPLREYPKREYMWAGSKPDDVGRRGEFTISAILAATAKGETQKLEGIRNKQSFQNIIAHWLKKLGLIHSFEIKEIAKGSNLYHALVKIENTSAEGTMLIDVGFGVSQVLPVLALLYYVPEGSTVLMEQPEIHLHPSAQSGLADLILTAAKIRNLQVIVESHSEHLLRRLQRRVAEGKTDSKSVNLYYTATNGGVARITNTGLNLFGEFENWPENFFGDEFGEIAATQKATLARKLGQRK